MKTKLIVLLTVLAVIGMIQTAKAASITTASPDKTSYLAGQTGHILVTIYNDENEKIRVTELSATISYYYTDGNLYIQKFFTSDTLPDEIPEGESETYQIPISLPTNLAHGYTNPRMEAITEIWHPQDGHWNPSDRPSYTNLKLYIETPYRQMYETSQQALTEQTQTMNILSIATVIFATAAGFLLFLVFKKPKPIAQV
jgi:hypothetical protein